MMLFSNIIHADALTAITGFTPTSFKKSGIKIKIAVAIVSELIQIVRDFLSGLDVVIAFW